jgi:M6 family metalloprotease-like protein
MHTLKRLLIVVSFLAGVCALAAEPSASKPDPSEYRTAENAVAAKVGPAGQAGRTGYLGVTLQRDARGRLAVEEVQPDSPAAQAGLKKGDVVTRVGDQAVRTPDGFREWLQTRGPGDAVKLALLRDDKPVEVTATLTATSRPMKPGPRVYLGVELGMADGGGGVAVERVTPGSPAAEAGLRGEDVIVKLDGKEVTTGAALADVLAQKKPADELTMTVLRGGKEMELKAKLTLERDRGGRGGFGGRPAGPPPLWTKAVFRLAVVPFEFSDVKHNAKVPLKEWEDLLFSRASYTKVNATGQPVHGSLNDYYREVSSGALRVEGKVFDWVELSKKRGDYVQGSGTSGKTVPLEEALGKLTKRDGRDALNDFDGLLFLYAGEQVRTNRGAVYYPHAGSVGGQNRRRPYFLTAEGGSRMATVSSFVKEFGQVLGLPELSARTENAGSEGLGPWCAMSNPLGGGRPQHCSAWAKEKMGWLKPTVLDPTVKQKLILSPIEDSSKECFKVLVRPDGSEYFLLENRRKRGFDSDLPGEGLLIWRVVNDRPILEESHGVEGPTGPTVQLSAVPYPSPANSAFTPDTIPSSRSPLGGGLPVHITNIRRFDDGRVTFQIGYEYR